MTESSTILDVRVEHRVGPDLTLDLAIALGREVGILFGPSGAGKSTLLRLIAGLTRPDLGRIHLGETTLSDSADRTFEPIRSRRVGLIFQDDLLFPHLTVEQNVRFGLKGWPRAEADARLLEVDDLCGLGPRLDRRPETLSGGERQRVGLARAIAPRPRLLLCDEPVSALDLEARQTLISRIKRIQAVEGLPILYVTHSPDEAVTLGHRLFLMERGRIVAEGPPLDVLSSQGSGGSIRLRNVFPARLEEYDGGPGESLVRIDDGPTLVVPRSDQPPGSRVLLSIRADDIVLARGSIGVLSARNLVEGRVVRVVPHGSEAQVLVATGGVVWSVGVVGSAVEALGLIEGSEVRMIVKARSCEVIRDVGT